MKKLEELLSLDRATVTVILSLMKEPRQPSELLKEGLGISRSRLYEVVGELVKGGMAERLKDGSIKLEPRFDRFLKSVDLAYRREILGEEVTAAPPPAAPPTPPPSVPPSRKRGILRRVGERLPRLIPGLAGFYDAMAVLLVGSGVLYLAYVLIKNFVIAQRGEPIYAIVTIIGVALLTGLPAAWLREKAQRRRMRTRRLRRLVERSE